MVENKEGFIEPQIVSDMCVDCGLCKQVCPAVHPYEKIRTRNKAVALQHKEDKIREKSTSGAAFVALSDVMLQQNGVVYGVIYDDNMVATHIRTTEKKERDLMCGSKYSQSEIGDIFDCVLIDLKNRKRVFFVGTSCQIDGLIRFLKQKRCDMSTLITCDLICHGVPSPLIWKEHIKHIEKVRGKKVVAYFNRSKIKGWHAHNEFVCYENGKQEWRTKLSQNFKDLFYGHYIIRRACSTCPYAGEPGVSDLTIGDFWGCEDIFPDKDDNKGTSILIINSTKGEKVFEECKEQINWWDVPSELALKYNHNKPIKHHPNREKFWDDYSSMGYAGVVKKYAGDTVKGRTKYYVKKWLRKILVKLKILHV